MKRLVMVVLAGMGGAWLALALMFSQGFHYLLDAVLLPTIYGMEGGRIVESIQTAFAMASTVMELLDKVIDMDIVLNCSLSLWSFDMGTKLLAVQRVLMAKLLNVLAGMFIPG